MTLYNGAVCCPRNSLTVKQFIDFSIAGKNMKKIACLVSFFLCCTDVLARECFVSAKDKNIDKINSCEPAVVLRDAVPQEGNLFDSVHLHEFTSSDLYTITILRPEIVGLGGPRIAVLKYEYKKMDGRLVLKTLTDQPKSECIQYFKVIETADYMTTINDGLDGPCEIQRIGYKKGVELKYKKIIH